MRWTNPRYQFNPFSSVTLQSQPQESRPSDLSGWLRQVTVGESAEGQHPPEPDLHARRPSASRSAADRLHYQPQQAEDSKRHHPDRENQDEKDQDERQQQERRDRQQGSSVYHDRES